MLSGAEADLISLYALLENRSEGLGDRFYRAIDAGLGQLSQQPLSAPVYLTPFRRLKIPSTRLACSTPWKVID